MAVATQKKLTLADLKRAAENFGATVEVENERCAISDEKIAICHVVSPRGYWWACDGSITMIVVRWYVGDDDDKQDALADAIERIGYGLDAMTVDELAEYDAE